MQLIASTKVYLPKRYSVSRSLLPTLGVHTVTTANAAYTVRFGKKTGPQTTQCRRISLLLCGAKVARTGYDHSKELSS